MVLVVAAAAAVVIVVGMRGGSLACYNLQTGTKHDFILLRSCTTRYHPQCQRLLTHCDRLENKA